MTFAEIRMGPWRPLYDYFARNRSEQAVSLSYEQVRSIIGFTLPKEALMVPTWWTVIPTKQRVRSWLAADRHPRAHEAGVDFARVTHLAVHSLSDQQWLRRRLLDRNAADQLSVIPNPADSELPWWRPRDLYVIHFPEARVVKVGLTWSGSRRIHEMRGAGGVLI